MTQAGYFGHVVRAGGMEDDVMLGRMNGARKRGRPRQRWLDTVKGSASGATISNMRQDETPEIVRDGEELPRLSPGVGCGSTAQGDKVIALSVRNLSIHRYMLSTAFIFIKIPCL